MKLQKESKFRCRTVLHPFAWQNDLLFFLETTRGAVFVDLHSRPGELLSYA